MRRWKLNKKYTTLAAVVRDQEYYIAEWLHYYLGVLGVEQAVIVVHKCKDRTEDIIRSLPYANRIRLHHVKNDAQHVQMSVYDWIAKEYGHSTKWMMYLDSDEFLVPKKQGLNESLQAYEHVGALAVQWLTFGAQGYVKRPPMPSIKYFTSCSTRFEENGNVKCVVNMEQFRGIISPHYFRTTTATVDETFTPVDPATYWQNGKLLPHEIFQCNHYHTRSMEDWVDRRKRGSCNDVRRSSYYDVDTFFRTQYNLRDDSAIGRYVHDLEKILAQ